MGWVGAIAAVLTAITALVGASFGVYKYIALKERMAAVRDAFSLVVDLLGSDDPVHRRAGAIMLRRFFDETTEQGGKGTPYAEEALNVIAATIRGAETGILQKLLADGLAHAPDLRGADLQKTNLQQAYLGERSGRTVDLSDADFFRADLSGASFKGAILQRAEFYQARAVNTVFRGADLTEANFYEADVRGADFEDAVLEQAQFARARNVPDRVARHLDAKGVYGEGAGPRDAAHPASAPISVFFSRPGTADIDHRSYFRALAARVEDEDFELVRLERDAYATTGAVAEVHRVMSACSGVVIAAVPDLEVEAATWRRATPECRTLNETGLTSPWTVLELGLAAGLGLPVFLALGEGVDPTVFDFGAHEPGLLVVDLSDDHRTQAFLERFADWAGAVREQSVRSAGG